MIKITKILILSILIILSSLYVSHAETLYIFRGWFIAPIDDELILNSLWIANVDPDPASTGFGGVRLSADGQEPATHIGSDSPMTGAMFGAFNVIKVQWSQKGLSAEPQFWKANYQALILTETNNGGTPGLPWGFDETIAELGLQRIQSEAP